MYVIKAGRLFKYGKRNDEVAFDMRGAEINFPLEARARQVYSLLECAEGKINVAFELRLGYREASFEDDML
jgi:hypothetical protein